MHLILDLGQLCAGKPQGGSPPAFEVNDYASGQREARISCVAVQKGQKLAVVLRMEPLILRSFEAVHGKVKPGDPLDINVCAPIKPQIVRESWGKDSVYLLITTDSLSRAPLAHSHTSSQQPATHPPEESQPA